MNRGMLLVMREVQGRDGPNMCLASSKFLVLKLLGLVDRSKHLNDFLHSRWARRHHALPLKSHWGGRMSEYNEAFNKISLPAALYDADGEVKPKAPVGRLSQGFVRFASAARADMMLRQRTPLVVGVSIHGGSARDHFIVVFADFAGHVWAIDPWPGLDDNAVVDLGADFSFARPTQVHLTADARHTTIPCGAPFFGCFQ